MDDKNLTPSLTLEDTPAAPSLTLDPFAEEEKAKAPDPVEETPLTPEEQKMVDDFAERSISETPNRCCSTARPARRRSAISATRP